MQSKPIETIVIVGGGTSGWMTASALSAVLRGKYKIRLVESDDIGIIGVGEATIPMIQLFNDVAGIDEKEFMRETQGTFKLGIEFVNWGKLGDRYMHGFGKIGQDLWTVGFDQYWHKMRSIGRAEDLEAYSITRMASKANKFSPPRADVTNSPFNDIAYAYHFDASLYARFLRKRCEARDVQRTEGKIVRVSQREGDGFVDAVVLESGERVEGDLFIDCSGIRALLIEGALGIGYEDWNHWLPCDRAIAVPCESVSPLTPYTRSTALANGWQWRIPLQNRIGNGHVYSSRHISDDEATATLLSNLDGKPLAEPRLVKYTPGMRKQGWNRNVVAIGLSSGFFEPLESTNIHLIQTAISRLIAFFPNQGFNPVEIAEYNRQSRFEHERIRDFIIAHYKVTQRNDSAFWRMCADMSVPESLTHKIELYESNGRLLRVDNELFAEPAWLQVFAGQNLKPRNHHALANLLPDDEIAQYLESVRNVIKTCVDTMPTHADYVARHCSAK
jgi:tryptophan halogenase